MLAGRRSGDVVLRCGAGGGREHCGLLSSPPPLLLLVSSLRRGDEEETRRRREETRRTVSPSGSDRGAEGRAGIVFNGTAEVVLVGLLKVR